MGDLSPAADKLLAFSPSQPGACGIFQQAHPEAAGFSHISDLGWVSGAYRAN
jgi:hypothetical protein